MKLNEINKPIIKTGLPGPKSKMFIEKREKNVPQGVSSNVPTIISRGEGAMIEDLDGNILMDFAGGIGVLNIGYSHPDVVRVVKEQAENFFHSSINVISYKQYIELAEKMNKIIPGDFPKRTMFVNSGAEAVENAVKIARKYTGRSEIISFTGAFHGRTLLTLSLTSKVKPYKYGFGPFAPGIHRAEFPYTYRKPDDILEDNSVKYFIDKLKNMFLEEVDPTEVAAIIIEPIQGEGGFIEAPKEYIKELRKICDEHGILLICDEVQTGFYRTGKMFAHEYWEVYPDIVTTAKSLAGGLPLSCVTAKEEIINSSQIGGIGGTYCGNPLATAAALKIIEIMEKEDFSLKVDKINKICMARFNEMKKKYDIIGDVRGKGAMLAMELVKNRETKEPAKEEVKNIVKEAYKKGLILLSAGVRGNVLRLLMPLVITEKQLVSGLDIIEDSIKNSK